MAERFRPFLESAKPRKVVDVIPDEFFLLPPTFQQRHEFEFQPPDSPKEEDKEHSAESFTEAEIRKEMERMIETIPELGDFDKLIDNLGYPSVTAFVRTLIASDSGIQFFDDLHQKQIGSERLDRIESSLSSYYCRKNSATH